MYILLTLQELQASGKQLAQAVKAAEVTVAAEKQRAAGLRKELAAERAGTTAAANDARCSLILQILCSALQCPDT